MDKTVYKIKDITEITEQKQRWEGHVAGRLDNSGSKG